MHADCEKWRKLFFTAKLKYLFSSTTFTVYSYVSVRDICFRYIHTCAFALSLCCVQTEWLLQTPMCTYPSMNVFIRIFHLRQMFARVPFQMLFCFVMLLRYHMHTTSPMNLWLNGWAIETEQAFLLGFLAKQLGKVFGWFDVEDLSNCNFPQFYKYNFMS